MGGKFRHGLLEKLLSAAFHWRTLKRCQDHPQFAQSSHPHEKYRKSIFPDILHERRHQGARRCFNARLSTPTPVSLPSQDETQTIVRAKLRPKLRLCTSLRLLNRLNYLNALAHRNRSDFCDLRLRCPSRTPEIARFSRQDKAMLHCDLRVRWKVASDLRFRAAISEPKTPSFCGIADDLALSTRRSLAIAIVRFLCAKLNAAVTGLFLNF